MSTSRGKPPIRAKSLRFLEIDGRTFIEIVLEDERRHQVPLDFYPTLLSATSQQRGNWEWIGRGFGVSWPDVDVDLSVEGMVAGLRERVQSGASKATGPATLPLPREGRSAAVIKRSGSTRSPKAKPSGVGEKHEVGSARSSARITAKKNSRTGEFRGVQSKHDRSPAQLRKK